jgi:polyisoprenoid-binding protein YceI
MSKPYFFAVLSLSVLIFAGCSNPADKVAKATVSQTNNAATATAAAPSEGYAKHFIVSPENSAINFVGSKVTGSHNGGFTKFTGELRTTNGKLVDEGNQIVIDMNSIYADNDRLTGHLKSPDFFNAAQIPTATFVTKSISQQATNSLVTGDLTLHGVTKQISFPANIRVTENSVELTANFAINRFDFEVNYPGKANDLIRKEVVLKLKVNAVPGPSVPATAKSA